MDGARVLLHVRPRGVADAGARRGRRHGTEARPRGAADGRRAGAQTDGTRLTERQRALLARLAGAGATAASDLGGAEPLRRLEARGLVALAPQVRPRRPAPYAVGSARRGPRA